MRVTVFVVRKRAGRMPTAVLSWRLGHGAVGDDAYRPTVLCGTAPSRPCGYIECLHRVTHRAASRGLPKGQGVGGLARITLLSISRTSLNVTAGAASRGPLCCRRHAPPVPAPDNTRARTRVVARGLHSTYKTGQRWVRTHTHKQGVDVSKSTFRETSQEGKDVSASCTVVHLLAPRSNNGRWRAVSQPQVVRSRITSVGNSDIFLRL